ncbi:MAG: hypothetical protein JWN00_4940 [Actinomycetia bacterium]|nr:hypothetical protein [Actinomycetes bacterium]
MTASKHNPQPRFGGWYSYQEWAEHGFITRDAHESHTRQQHNSASAESAAPHETRHSSASAESAESHETRSQRDAEAAEVARGHATAARLALSTPGWYLMYGASTRLIWAFPTFPGAPRGLILSDQDPVRLYGLIQRAQAEHRQ